MKAKFDINGIKMEVVSLENVYQKPMENKNFAKTKCSKFRIKVAAFGSNEKDSYGSLIEIFNKKDVNAGVDASIELIDEANDQTLTTLSFTNTHIIEFAVIQPDLTLIRENENLNMNKVFLDMVIGANDYTLFGTQVI